MTNPPERYVSFRKRLDAFMEAARRIHEGDVEAVHQTRVASRRLREWVPLLALDRDSARNSSRSLRKVTKRLGRVRELDVLMLLIDELSRDGAYSSAALKQVEAHISNARTVARERLASKLPLEKIKALEARLRAAEHLERNNTKRHRRSLRGPKLTWLLALEARVAHRATRVRSAIENAGALYTVDRLHDVRIALKKLRYATELLAEARSQRTTDAIEALQAAQDLLGRLHDREVLIARTRRLQMSAPSLDLTAANPLGLLAHALEHDCRRIHARYMHDREKLTAIADRMGAAMPADALVNRRVAS